MREGRGDPPLPLSQEQISDVVYVDGKERTAHQTSATACPHINVTGVGYKHNTVGSQSRQLRKRYERVWYEPKQGGKLFIPLPDG